MTLWTGTLSKEDEFIYYLQKLIEKFREIRKRIKQRDSLKNAEK